MFRTPFPDIRLVPATLPLLEALETDRARFGALIGSPVPERWPQFPESVRFTRDRLAESPEDVGWWMHFFVDPGTGTLLGSGGYTGPPREGTVEIGYEVAPEFRGKRYGVGAAAALVRRAAATGLVGSVIAHTLPRENASTHVLTALGFARDGESVDPDEGTVWRWRLPLSPKTGQLLGEGDTTKPRPG